MATKKSKAAADVKYELGDVVLAKVKGFPSWPSTVVDPETVPKDVKKERPVSKKTQFYCVRFFPTGDYSWATSKDMSKLQPHEIQAFINEPNKKNGDLMKGYQIASDPAEYLANWEKARLEAEEKEKHADVDQLDEEGEEELEPSTKPKAQKRKRDSEGGAKTKKETKKAAPATKKTVTASRKKRNGAISAEMIESEEEGVEEGVEKKTEKKAAHGDEHERPAKKAKKDTDAEDDEVSTDPEAIKVKDWRHKLQRAFLTKATPPQEADMEVHSKSLETVEEYSPHLTVALLQTSKIGKVMRKIAQLPDNAIPRDDEFKIRERAAKLVNEWQSIVSASGKKDGDVINGDGEVEKEHAVNGENGKENKMDVDAPSTVPAPEAPDDMKIDDPPSAIAV